MLQELAELEERQNRLQVQLADLQETQPMPADLNMADVTGAVLEALDQATEKERGQIIRGFISSIIAAKIGNELTGEVHYSPPIDGAQEIDLVVPL